MKALYWVLFHYELPNWVEVTVGLLVFWAGLNCLVLAAMIAFGVA